MKVMLDTNICIYMINKRPSWILDNLHSYRLGEIGISSIVYSELLYGVYKSKKIEQNLIALNQFSYAFSIKDYDEAAADEYGKIRANLEMKGKTVGANDLLIAAHAISLNVPLATNNIREFSLIENLSLLDWMQR